MTQGQPSCGAVLPNPSNRGDAHLHVCTLDSTHVDPGPGGGVPVPRHQCGQCPTSWVNDLRSDGKSATLIRFPSSGPGAPDIDLRRTERGYGECLICDEPIEGGRRFEEFAGRAYHWDCRSAFQFALQAAENVLSTLINLEHDQRRLYLIRVLAAQARGD